MALGVVDDLVLRGVVRRVEVVSEEQSYRLYKRETCQIRLDQIDNLGRESVFRTLELRD